MGDIVTNNIIGSLITAVTIAEKAAKESGYNTAILSTKLIGEARELGKVFGSILANMVESDSLIQKPACVIAGGETTVTIPPEFIDLGDEFKYEVLAREESFNQTAIESCFVIVEE